MRGTLDVRVNRESDNAKVVHHGSASTNSAARRTARSCWCLQGGGALGAYQAGVYQALHEAGIEPDWIIGTSIGAINASLIAGNKPADRLAKLEEFWGRMSAPGVGPLCRPGPACPTRCPIGRRCSRHPRLLQAQSAGVPGNARAARGATAPATTRPRRCEKTLTELVDFSLVNAASRG